MKNVLLNIKSVITGSSKAVAGAGAETNSFFGSTTLALFHRVHKETFKIFN
jgi:hypothetical protein